jgi:hypothetical protein
MTSTRALRWWAIAAVVFGALTVISGGRALFGGPEARAAVGDAVGFVLWFNFAAGFVYMITAVGVWLRRPWSRWAALLIALATGVVCVAFAVHVLSGGAYEMRTVGALALRLAFWVALAAVAMRAFRA